MKRRTFLKSIIAVVAIPGLSAVKLTPERTFIAKSLIDNMWAKTYFDMMLENMNLTAFIDKSSGLICLRD